MFHVYVDFDGVLASCLPTAEKVLGKTGLTNKEFWSVANLPSFFLDLPKTPEANTLMDFLWHKHSLNKTRSLKALTATGDNYINVGLQKKQWAVNQHLFAREAVLLVRSGKDKAAYATPKSILVDDTLAVIQNWEAHGGIGILHTSLESTLRQLSEILS